MYLFLSARLICINNHELIEYVHGIYIDLNLFDDQYVINLLYVLQFENDKRVCNFLSYRIPDDYLYT